MLQNDSELAERLIFRRLSHDMNNCLTMLSHICELGKLRMDPEFALNALDKVEGVAKRIEATQTAIGDLFYGQCPRVRRGDVSELLRQVIKMFDNFEEIDLAITFQKPEGAFEVETDFLWLERLLIHILLGVRQWRVSVAALQCEYLDSIGSGEYLVVIDSRVEEGESFSSSFGSFANHDFQAAEALATRLGCRLELPGVEKLSPVRLYIPHAVP